MDSQTLIKKLAQVNLNVYATVPKVVRFPRDRPINGLNKLSIIAVRGSNPQKLGIMMSENNQDSIQLDEVYQEVDHGNEANILPGPNLTNEIKSKLLNVMSANEIIAAVGQLKLPVYLKIDTRIRIVKSLSFGYADEVGLLFLVNTDEDQELNVSFYKDFYEKLKS